MAAEDSHEDHAGRRAALLRLAAYLLLLGVVLAAASLTGSIPSVEEVRDWGDDLGPTAPLLFVPLFVLVNFVIAWAVLTGACGLLFGTAEGTAVALAGVTAASVAQMAVARWLVRGHHGRLLPQRTKRIERFLESNGTIAVMESRLVPFLPFGLVNYTAGLTRMAYRDVALGTFVGAAPKVFAYAALGGSLDDLGAPEVKVAVVVLVVMAITGAVLVRRQVRNERQGPAPAA